MEKYKMSENGEKSCENLKGQCSNFKEYLAYNL